ncbi:hypothetical protein [Dactylosporangium sp. NPDC051541]|uniref:hypothetical protein n=1 Tax=Dactylosporangium sp. NPDC051541 TaxID=3363977 RepID=UPI00379F3818
MELRRSLFDTDRTTGTWTRTVPGSPRAHACDVVLLAMTTANSLAFGRELVASTGSVPIVALNTMLHSPRAVADRGVPVLDSYFTAGKPARRLSCR